MLRKERRFATEKCLKGHSYEFVRSPGGWQMRLVDDVDKIKHPDNMLIDPKECLYNQGRPMDLDETGLINILDDELETSRAVEIKTDNGLSYHVPGFSTVVAKAAEPTEPTKPKKEKVQPAKTKLGIFIMKQAKAVTYFIPKKDIYFLDVPPILFAKDTPAVNAIGKGKVRVNSVNNASFIAKKAYNTALEHAKGLDLAQRKAAELAATIAFKPFMDKKPAVTKIAKQLFVNKLEGEGPICDTLECSKSYIMYVNKNGKKQKIFVSEIMAGTGMPPAVIAPLPKPTPAVAGGIKYSIEGQKADLDVSLLGSLKGLAQFAGKKKNANESVKINVYSGKNTAGGHETGQHPVGLAVDFKIEVDGKELKDDETYGLTLAAMALGVMDDGGIGYYMGNYDPTSGRSTNRGIHYDQQSPRGNRAWLWFKCGGDGPAVTPDFKRKWVTKCNGKKFNEHPRGRRVGLAKGGYKLKTTSKIKKGLMIQKNPLSLPQNVITYARMYYTPESDTV